MKIINLSGQTFGRLTVIEQAGSTGGHKLWRCKCECGNETLVRSAALRCGHIKGCGCFRLGKDKDDLAKYLLENRVIDGECWIWSRLHNEKGYGLVAGGRYRKTIAVHRLAAHLWLSMPLDDERCVCHTCDNPPCFNPKHLFLGTQQENVWDSINKGRRHGRVRHFEIQGQGQRRSCYPKADDQAALLPSQE